MGLTLGDALAQVKAHVAANRLRQAAALCAQVLAAVPSQPDALRWQGAIAWLEGNHAAACETVARSLAVPSGDPRVRGTVAVTLRDAGQDAAALALFDEILAQRDDVFAWRAHAGQAAQSIGEIDAGIVHFRRALELKPDVAALWALLGALLLVRERHAEAEPVLRRALDLAPGDAGVQGNLGIALRGAGRYGESIGPLRAAMAAAPSNADLYAHLAHALHALGRHEEAASAFGSLARLRPGDADACNNVGVELKLLARFAEAEDAFRQALARRADHVEAIGNLAATCANLGRHAEAAALYRQAIALRPDFALLHANLAQALLWQGRHDEARAVVEAAWRAFPSAHEARSGLLYAMTCDPQCSAGDYLAACREYGAALAADTPTHADWPADARGSDLATLRVGFVSGDLRAHPVGYFLENLLVHLDRSRIEAVAYSARALPDEVTARLQAQFAAWHEIGHLGDAALAARIRDDRIHVLVDLAGHTAHNRLPVFARRPAPMQVAWLGWFASTGLPAMDWILVDRHALADGGDGQFTERPWCLPETRLCFTPPANAPAVGPLPALATGCITFGACQNLLKLNDRVLRLWARVLAAVPGSRLVLRSADLANEASRIALSSRFAAICRDLDAQEGIVVDGGRFVPLAPLPRAGYLAAYADIDLLLDTFPFPGGTTTCEALWMGVPTLTLAGDTLLSRQGAGLLVVAGLGDWVARDEEEYLRLAVGHAFDTASLAALRARMRDQVAVSPLCDGARFARDFADALHAMWRVPGMH